MFLQWEVTLKGSGVTERVRKLTCLCLTLPAYLQGENSCADTALTWQVLLQVPAGQCSCVSLLQVLARDLIGATASSGRDVRVWSCVLHPPDLSATKRKRTRCARIMLPGCSFDTAAQGLTAVLCLL